MFTINQSLEDNCIELTNSILGSYAKIHLNQGASVQELILNSKQIIKDCFPLTYEESYASAIMFPFASRINNGVYSFKGREYQLNKNDAVNNCALHGLLYNKVFTVTEKQTTDDFASVTLCYVSDGSTQGFPYKYEFTVTYRLTNFTLQVEVNIKNLDTNSFPFGIGWHPYFYSKNLHDSYINFESNSKAIFNDNMVVEGFKDVKMNRNHQIANNQLDNCYELESNKIYFTTPQYNLELTSSPKSGFLQLYTPPENKKLIAIEPITAPSNSFNNKIGLQVLESKEEYNMTWKIKLIDKDI